MCDNQRHQFSHMLSQVILAPEKEALTNPYIYPPTNQSWSKISSVPTSVCDQALAPVLPSTRPLSSRDSSTPLALPQPDIEWREGQGAEEPTCLQEGAGEEEAGLPWGVWIFLLAPFLSPPIPNGNEVQLLQQPWSSPGDKGASSQSEMGNISWQDWS